MIRSVWILSFGVLYTFWYAGQVWLMALFRRHEALKCRCDGIQRGWAKAVLRKAGIRVRIEGGEHLTEGDGRIIASNHESWFDVFALAAYLPGEYRFVAKKELRRIPIFGRSWVACGHVSIDRQNRESAVESLAIAADQITERRLAVVMFPEGTRSRDGYLGEFKRGAFVLAIQAGVPVVPVAVLGSRHIMPKGSFRIGRGEIVVKIGEPVPVQGLAHKDRADLQRTVRSRIAQLRGGEGPVPPQMPSDPEGIDDVTADSAVP